jgi:hypothetical protein
VPKQTPSDEGHVDHGGGPDIGWARVGWFFVVFFGVVWGRRVRVLMVAMVVAVVGECFGGDIRQAQARDRGG